MNKMEYLERLESCLKWKVSKRELDDIMRDYAEYFEEGRRQSKSDSEISAKLGDPEIVAGQIIEEIKQPKASYQEPHAKEHKKQNHTFSKKIKKSLKSLSSGIGHFFYLIMTFPMMVISIVLPILIAIVMIGTVSLFGLTSIASLIAGIVFMIGSGVCFVLVSPQIGLTALFASIAAISFGVSWSCLTAFIARKFWGIESTSLRWVMEFIQNILSIPYKREYVEPIEDEEGEPLYEEGEKSPYQSPEDPLYRNLQEILKNKQENETKSTFTQEAKEEDTATVNKEVVESYIEPLPALEEIVPQENRFPISISKLGEGTQNA